MSKKYRKLAVDELFVENRTLRRMCNVTVTYDTAHRLFIWKNVCHCQSDKNVFECYVLFYLPIQITSFHAQGMPQCRITDAEIAMYLPTLFSLFNFTR